MLQLKNKALILALAGNVVGKILQDGKIDWKDIPHFLELGEVLMKINKVSFEQLALELKALNKKEIQEIAEILCRDFSIPQKDIEAKIEMVISIVVVIASSSFDVFQLIKAISKAK